LADTRAELSQHAASVPWYNSYINRGAVTALFTGTDFFEPYFVEKLRAGIQFMIHRRGPFLIHCDNGMDRTGFVMVLFEALMGASPDEIVEDYMQSYVNYYGFEKDEERYRIISQIPLNYLCAMNEGRLITADNTSQAAEHYLIETNGLNSGIVAELKKLLAGN
jgi:hypothetical protein